MLSKKLQASTACIISFGKTVCVVPPSPADVIIVLAIPCTILNIAIINSKPYVTIAFAIAKRIKSFNACYGFLTSAKLPQVFITPITKNNTNNASPIACIAP